MQSAVVNTQSAIFLSPWLAGEGSAELPVADHQCLYLSHLPLQYHYGHDTTATVDSARYEWTPKWAGEGSSPATIATAGNVWYHAFPGLVV